MIGFQWPWLLLLLPLPLLLQRLMPPVLVSESAALRVPDPGAFEQGGPQVSETRPSRAVVFWAAFAAWGLLVTAAARPIWSGEPVQLPVSGRDLMLAVDLSGSMSTADFILGGRQISRLAATQSIAGEFIERRVGDRLGLILFGRQAYVQTPLTFDRSTVRQLLFEAAIGLAGKETAIGDAIGLAVKRLRDDQAQSRVLILLTDGANTAGEVEPLKAAHLAADAGLTIYTIGIGADEMLVDTLFARQRINPSRDLDEKTLRGIAEATGGRYFRARDTEELKEIYRLLDQLEPMAKEQETFRPQRALFHWPLALALLIAATLIGFKTFKEQ